LEIILLGGSGIFIILVFKGTIPHEQASN
jgi:hypothetical protein